MHKRTFLGLTAVVGLALGLGLVAGNAVAAPPAISTLLNRPVFIKCPKTNRFILSTGDAIQKPGAEGGWTKSPAVVGSDANYYDRAVWVIKPSGEGYVIENSMNHRLLFSTGEPPAKAEGGWTASPNVVGTDSNYYNRAIWKIKPSGDGYILENAFTKRMLLSAGEAPAKGEGGWTSSPSVVGADANYYDRAVWSITAK